MIRAENCYARVKDIGQILMKRREFAVAGG
jgi:hypothetical protein